MTFNLETIVSRAKRRGFVYPWSDIYGGLANAWDLGPYGSLLRKNIADQWIKYFVQEQENIMLIDGALLMHPKVWEASGHVSGFNDPLIDDKKTGERFRADKLIEDDIGHKLQTLSEDEVLKNIQKDVDKNISSIVADSWTNDQQYIYITGYKLKNPNNKKDAEWTNIRKFSLMLATKLWVIEDDSAKVWLRPETAQAMFVNFKNVIDTTRARLPFGLAQIGKAFRNEITPGNFLFRTREFEQMEIQMFVKPEESEEQFTKFIEQAGYFWKEIIGLKEENMRTRDHGSDELAHYARQAKDYEFKFPRWRGELNGIHDRTDFDVKAHQEYSGKNLQYNDPMTGKRYIPYVIELSMGLSRAILTTMADAYDEEKYMDGNWAEQIRTVARFHKNIAPIKFAVIPLVKKDEKIVAMARDIFKKLSKEYMCEFDDSGSIGKSYRRQDEIGTPYCITVDYQSIEDGTITLRTRDDMKQIRIKPDEIVF